MDSYFRVRVCLQGSKATPVQLGDTLQAIKRAFKAFFESRCLVMVGTKFKTLTSARIFNLEATTCYEDKCHRMTWYQRSNKCKQRGSIHRGILVPHYWQPGQRPQTEIITLRYFTKACPLCAVASARGTWHTCISSDQDNWHQLASEAFSWFLCDIFFVLND